MTELCDEFDSPWKDILEAYFQDFMAFFFPHIHDDIDWSQGYDFLDQELQQVVRDAELGKRLTDKLVKVWQRSGEETWVLIHIEIQSQEERQFSDRMFVYYYRLRDKYHGRLPVWRFWGMSGKPGDRNRFRQSCGAVGCGLSTR